MKNIIKIAGVIVVIILIQSCTKEADNGIRDIDGNVYTSVTIGTQVWLVENLKTTRYRNGDLIGTTTPATLDISSEATPKYQWAYDGLECSVAVYGRLYTWYAATEIRGVCPTGWHVPDMTEWITLYYPFDHPLEGSIGAELMEPGTTHWNRSDIMGTNETGFTALPGGERSNGGSFHSITHSGKYWNFEDSPYSGLTQFYLIPIDGNFGMSPSSLLYEKASGLSIRCIKDSI